MLPSCREVSEQLSEDIDEPVSGFRWFKLKLHLMMCDYCRRYEKQIKISAKSINLAEPKVAPSEDLKKALMDHYQTQAEKEQSSAEDKQD